jgi:hypothetical protein
MRRIAGALILASMIGLEPAVSAETIRIATWNMANLHYVVGEPLRPGAAARTEADYPSCTPTGTGWAPTWSRCRRSTAQGREPPRRGSRTLSRRNQEDEVSKRQPVARLELSAMTITLPAVPGAVSADAAPQWLTAPRNIAPQRLMDAQLATIGAGAPPSRINDIDGHVMAEGHEGRVDPNTLDDTYSASCWDEGRLCVAKRVGSW